MATIDNTNETLSDDRIRAEINKLLAEQLKLNAEQQKLMAEQQKFNAESAKMTRERTWYPAVVIATAAGAGAALSGVLLKFWG